jgi:hypothetical protein
VLDREPAGRLERVGDLTDIWQLGELTIVAVCRRSRAESTAASRTPKPARSAANSSPVGPPTGATTLTSSPSACSTRATLTALPPALAETVCARLVACSVKRSTP